VGERIAEVRTIVLGNRLQENVRSADILLDAGSKGGGRIDGLYNDYSVFPRFDLATGCLWRW